MSEADFNTGTRNTPLGEPKTGISPDLDALAAYVSSLTEYPKSSFRTGGNATTAGQNGRQHFLDLRCFTCHGGPDFTDSAYGELHNIGTIKASSGGRLGGLLPGIDTPTLRGIASTAPYLHDGSAAELAAVFNVTNAPENSPHAVFRSLASTEQNELIAFLSELDDAETAVPAASPRLEITLSASGGTLRWPGAATGFGLRSTTNLTPPIVWTAATNGVQTTGGVFSVTVPLNEENRFFLLESD
jgi:hypothetical protein